MPPCYAEHGSPALHGAANGSGVSPPSVHLGTYLNRLWERVFPMLGQLPGGQPQGERENSRTPASACVLLERMIERGNRWGGGLPRIEAGGTLWLSDTQLERVAPHLSARQARDLLAYLARVNLVRVEMRGHGRARERHISINLAMIRNAEPIVGAHDGAARSKHAAPRQTLAPGRRDTVATLPSPVNTICRTTPASDPVLKSAEAPEAAEPAAVPELTEQERVAAGPAIRAYQTHERCPKRNQAGYPVRSDQDRAAARLAAVAITAGAPRAQVAEVVRAHLSNYPQHRDRSRSPYVLTFGWIGPALADLAERALQRRHDPEETPPPAEVPGGLTEREARALDATQHLGRGELRRRLAAARIAHDEGASGYVLRSALVAAVLEGTA